MNRYRRQQLSEINVVPYIDVMLVLLVIFMVTTPLIHQSVKIDLPQADSSLTEDIDKLPIILTINAQKEFSLNVGDKPDKPLDKDDVLTNVIANLQLAKSRGEKPEVMVKGDRNVYYHVIMDGIMLLKKAGVDNISLITTPND